MSDLFSLLFGLAHVLRSVFLGTKAKTHRLTQAAVVNVGVVPTVVRFERGALRFLLLIVREVDFVVPMPTGSRGTKDPLVAWESDRTRLQRGEFALSVSVLSGT